MALEKATGIIIRLGDYSETSQIAVFLTDAFGRVSAIAKGAKRPRSSTGGTLDMLTLNEIVFSPSSSGGLATLREARTLEQYAGVRASTARYYAALYLAELAFIFSEGADGSRGCFDLVVSSLGALAARPVSVANTVAFFEAGMLSLSGLAPNLETCARCGQKPDGHSVRISLEDGGILCGNCRGGVPVTRGCLASLRRVFRSSVAGVQRLRLPKAVEHDVGGLLTAFIVHHTRSVPRMARYVKPYLDGQLRKWSPQARAAK